MLNHHLFYKLPHLLLELWLYRVSTFLISNDLYASHCYLIHELEAGGLVNLDEFKSEFENGLVLGVVSFKWDLLEDALDHLGVVCWSLIRRKRHVLVLNDSA